MAKVVDAKRYLVIPDCHFPYVNREAWNLMLHVARSVRVYGIIILGDFVDCYAVSTHERSPMRKLSMVEEIDSANAALDELDTLGAVDKRFLSGNHEVRIERYLANQAAALQGFITTQALLGLKRRKWEFVPYRDSTRVGAMHFTHETGTAGERAHLDAQNAFEGNVIIGHTHGLRMSYRGNSKGESHVGVSLGWLGDASQCDYMHGVKAAKLWTTAFGLGYLEPDGFFHIDPIPIIGGRCRAHGQVWHA